jgi:D-cysteine desulfhydrase
VIPYGGASPLGTIGFVNAAFELKQQIKDGEVPEPDVIYVATGSMGTAVGLVLGLKAAGLKTRVVPVRVVPSQTTNPTKFVTLFNETNALLHAADLAFPIYELPENDVGIVHDFFGSGYGALTKEGVEAIRLVGETERIKLDVTYTGKAFAALIDAAQKGELTDQVVLFWLTLNSRDFSDVIEGVDYHELPRCFHRYFEEEVRPRS